MFDRPDRPLLWFHTASVGETSSILDLLSEIREKYEYNILLTTATRSAKQLVQDYLSRETAISLIHQYAPLDVPDWMAKFIAFWQPEAAIFVESEVWPVRLKICQRHHIPAMLIGGRLSDFSFNCWKHFPFLMKIILRCFSWISARDTENQNRFSAFDNRIIFRPALDLKLFKTRLPFSEIISKNLKNSLPEKKKCVIISTHPKEEIFFFNVMKKSEKIKDWLFILIPRHPERGKKIASTFGNTPLRSRNEYPESKDSFWIIDTIGETGLFFSIADCAFIGGSLYPQGKGHNPYEAIRFQLHVAAGPWRANWKEAYDRLAENITTISTEDELIEWLTDTETSKPLLNILPDRNPMIQLAAEIHHTVCQSQ